MKSQNQAKRGGMLACVVLTAFVMVGRVAQAADKDVVNTNANWTTAADWTGGTLPANGDNIFIDMTANPVKTITLATTPLNSSMNEVGLARWGTGTAIVNQTGGSLTADSFFNLGQGFSPGPGVGIWSMSGNAVLNLTHSAGGYSAIGVSGGAAGFLNLSGTAQVIQAAGDIRVAGENNWSGAGTTGAIALNDSSMLSLSNGWLLVGNASGAVGGLTVSSNAQVTVATGNTVVGNGVGTMGTITLADNSTFTQQSGEFWVGQAGGGNCGTMMMSGSSVLTLGSYLVVGRGGGSGTMTVSGNAQVYANGGVLFVGTDSGSTGVLAVAGSAKINSQVVTTIGAGGGTGSCRLTDSAVINATNEFWVGDLAGGSGMMTMSDLSVLNLSSWLIVGRNHGAGTLTINGGTINCQSPYPFAVGAMSGSGIVIQNGGYVSNAVSALMLGSDFSGTGSATYNLNGGTLEANRVYTDSAAGTSSFNFNGGTLKAMSDNATFMQGLTAATVQPGGVVIDANGKNIVITQSLLDGGGSGGLVKRGGGTLTISGTNTYTGATTISNGVLRLGWAQALPTNAPVTVANGTYNLGGFAVTNGLVTLTSGRIVNGTLNAGALNVIGDHFIWPNVTCSGNLTKSGFGTLRMASFGGGSNIVSGGTVEILSAPVPAVMAESLAWFDADDAGTISTSAMGQVTAWVNKGSAGATLDAEQVTAGAGPVVTPNALNGRSVLTVSNTASLWTKNNVGISGSQDRTLFAVGCRQNGGSIFFAHLGSMSTDNAFGISSESIGQFNYLWADDLVLGVQPTDVYEIFDFMIAGGSGTANVINGDTLASGVQAMSPNTTDGKLYLGSRPFGLGQGAMAEVILFNRALTAQERADVELYLRDKWFTGTLTPPPAGDVVITSPGVLLLPAGTNTVRSLTVNGELLLGNRLYSATNLPGVLSGPGVLLPTQGAPPRGTLIRIF